MKRLALFIAVPILLAFTTPTVVTWSARSVNASSRAPGQAVIRVRGDIVNKWHVYSMTQKPGGPKPLTFELENANGFSLGTVKAPKAQLAYDAEFKIPTETYSGTPTFEIPVRWTRQLSGGSNELRLVIRYMACSDKLCLPPRKESLAIVIKSPSSK
jgi:thiol:disulfide interchange protein DsbD